MNYYLDTEFVNEHECFELISIALVCEDGREYYAVNRDVKLQWANQFVKDHVIPVLYKTFTDDAVPRPSVVKSLVQIAGELDRFLVRDAQGHKPTIWGYYCDFDWVLFSRLFGGFDDQPECLPMWCRDLKQLCESIGDPRLPAKPKTAHHALIDARWNLEAHQFLIGYEATTSGRLRG